MLFQGISAKAAAGRDVSINRQRLIACRNDFNPRADGGSIGLFSDKFHRQPMIPLTGVLEQNVVVLVAGNRSPHLDGNVNVAVTIPVAAAHAVALLQMPGTGRGTDVDKSSAPEVAKHAVRNERRDVVIARAEIEVKKSIIVEVGKIGPHGGETLVQPDFLGDVFKTLTAHVA